MGEGYEDGGRKIEEGNAGFRAPPSSIHQPLVQNGFLTSTTIIPAAVADRTPRSASSNATHLSGGTPSRRAASRKTSGAGLPWATSSAVAIAAKWCSRPSAESVRVTI